MSDFVKQIYVEWDKAAAKFDDMLELSSVLPKMPIPPVVAERSNDTAWVTMPYISPSYSGRDATGNFAGNTQLAVPCRQGYEQHSSWQMTSPEIRDAMQQGKLFDSAVQMLASDVEQSCKDVASLQGTIVVPRTASATGFDDVGLAQATMDELGIQPMDRIYGFSPRDYISAASNLASRQTVQGIAESAYSRAVVNRIADGEILRMGYAPRINASTATGVSITNADSYYVPQGTTLVGGERVPVDNRYQTVNITVTGGILKAGDAFTITGVNAVHHITKQDTGQLKTFRVISGPAGGGTGNYVISPPIISAQGGSRAEVQYQNVTATPAAGAVVTMLNVDSAYANPFFYKGAIQLLPGRVAVEPNMGAQVRRTTTESGIEIVMTAQIDINTLNVNFRVDAKWGVTMLQPQMAGLLLFNQVP